MRALALPLLGLMLLAAGGSCAAQTVIHRCTAADGTPVFTDQACASLGALPVRSTVNPLASRRTHAPPRHCPLDIGSLRERVASAFRNHDANALAGLMLWSGYGPREATDVVRRLAELMRSPFLGFDDSAQPPATATSAWWPPLVPAAASTTPLAPVATATMTLKLGNPVQPELKLDVTRRDGCVWLQPPGAVAPASR